MATREMARAGGSGPLRRRGLPIRRFEAAGPTWPLPNDVIDAVPEARLFASAGVGPGTRRGYRRQEGVRAALLYRAHHHRRFGQRDPHQHHQSPAFLREQYHRLGTT
jgi:hypothetical protein